MIMVSCCLLTGRGRHCEMGGRFGRKICLKSRIAEEPIAQTDHDFVVTSHSGGQSNGVVGLGFRGV